MSLVAIVFSRCRLIALGAFFLVAPMASVSQAVTVAADTFTRANSNDLGSTEVGGFAYQEVFIQNLLGDPDVAQITNNELELLAGTGMAVLDVGLSDLTATADVHFVGGTAGFNTKSRGGMVFRMSNMELGVPGFFDHPDNLGLVLVWFSPSGGVLVGENRTTDFSWDHIDNPFNEEVDFQTYGFPGSLPTTINGVPFDANGDGRLGEDEPFQVSVVLSGTNVDVQFNGMTIRSVTLDNAGGLSDNHFGPLKWTRIAGDGSEPTVAFDNLIIDGMLPGSDLNMDGFVDGLDLGILLGNWNTTTTPEMGELNGIPPVDGLDLGILLGDWNPSPLAVAGAVPEPSTLALLSLALGAVSLRRSRSQVIFYANERW